MVLPTLLTISFISIGILSYLYYTSETKRKDLQAKFKTTVSYAEKISKSLSLLEEKNKALTLAITALKEKLYGDAPQVNGSVNPEVKKAPRKRGPRRKNNTNTTSN